MKQLEQALAILKIKRVAMKPLAKQINPQLAAAVKHDQEFWFGPGGEPISIYTPEEGLAALKRCAKIENMRRGQ